MSDTAPKAAGCAGRVGASLFFGIFLCMGLVFTVIILREAWNGAKTRNWDQADCRIITAGPVIDWNKGSPYSFAATYSYTYHGKTYQSDQVSLKPLQTDDYRPIQRLASACVPGETAPCWINPADPTQAVLAHGRDHWAIFFVIIPLVFVLIGGGGIIGTWRTGAKDTRPEPLKGKKASGRLVARIICLILIVIGAILTSVITVPLGLNLVRAPDWTPTPCHVIHSKVLSHRSDDSTTYSAEVLYEYQFNDRTYRSDRLGFLNVSGGRSGARRLVDTYRSGGDYTCYVDPGDPANAVLRPGFPPIYLLALIPLVVAVGGLLGLIATFRNKPAETPLATTGSRRRDHSPGRPGGVSAPAADREAPIVLKCSTSPYTGFIVVSLIMFFWNGIVSVFIWQVVESFRRGHPEWFLVVFLTPFVLVGIALILGVIHQFLSLFNPAPQFRLTPGVPAPGATAVLQWRLKGRADRLSSFKIDLQGVEGATYRQGTRTTTEKHVFHTDHLVDTVDPREMRSGEVFVTLPYPSMHSFTAEHNKIVWLISVHGDIARWPDIKQEFTFQVLP